MYAFSLVLVRLGISKTIIGRNKFLFPMPHGRFVFFLPKNSVKLLQLTQFLYSQQNKVEFIDKFNSEHIKNRRE